MYGEDNCLTFDNYVQDIRAKDRESEMSVQSRQMKQRHRRNGIRQNSWNSTQVNELMKHSRKDNLSIWRGIS